MPRLVDIAVLALEPVAPFELGVLCEVFGIDRSADGLPGYEFAVCGRTPGRVRARGFDLVLEHGLDRLAQADLVAVPAWGGAVVEESVGSDVIAALQAAHARGAMVMSVCSGTFALGAAGLLDNRRCTTHWKHTDELRRRYPAMGEIRTAVLWYKSVSVCRPDYYAQFLETSPWIHQPFEAYEGCDIETLRQPR